MLNFIESQIKQKFKTWIAYEKAAGIPARHGKRRVKFYLDKLSMLLKPLGLKIEIETIKMKNPNKILVFIEKGDDGIYSAFTPDLKTTVLNGQGHTEKEALKNLKESYWGIIESYQAKSEQIPVELQQPFKFKVEKFKK